MDQQDNPAVPGASARKGQPAPVWGGAPDDHASDAPDHATYEPIPQQPHRAGAGPFPVRLPQDGARRRQPAKSPAPAQGGARRSRTRQTLRRGP